MRQSRVAALRTHQGWCRGWEPATIKEGDPIKNEAQKRDQTPLRGLRRSEGVFVFLPGMNPSEVRVNPKLMSILESEEAWKVGLYVSL